MGLLSKLFGSNDERGPFEQRIAELKAEIRALERAKRQDDERLIGLLFELGAIQGVSDQTAAAEATQRKMLAVGERSGVPAALLAKGYQRLARLCQEQGKHRQAQGAQSKVSELLAMRDATATLPMTIKTQPGHVQVVEPTDRIVAQFGERWPLSVFAVQREEHVNDNRFAHFAISLRTHSRSMPGVLFVLHEHEDEAFARRLATTDRYLVAHALGNIASAGQDGAVLLASFVRASPSQPGVYEAGVFLFACPTPADRRRRASDPVLAQIDEMLMPGTARIAQDVLAALQSTKVPWFPFPGVRGIAVSDATSVDGMLPTFATAGPIAYHLHHELDEADEKVWWAVADGGVEQVVHMPLAMQLCMMPDPRAAAA